MSKIILCVFALILAASAVDSTRTCLVTTGVLEGVEAAARQFMVEREKFIVGHPGRSESQYNSAAVTLHESIQLLDTAAAWGGCRAFECWSRLHDNDILAKNSDCSNMSGTWRMERVNDGTSWSSTFCFQVGDEICISADLFKTNAYENTKP